MTLRALVRYAGSLSAIVAGMALIWFACRNTGAHLTIIPGTMAGGGTMHLPLVQTVIPGVMGVGIAVVGLIVLLRRRPRA
jgi:hypothetical protein